MKSIKSAWRKVGVLNIIWLLVFLTTGVARAEDDSIPILTIALESRGESLEGQTAVGEVIRNRAKASRKPFEAICKAPAQFSCWNSPTGSARALESVTGEEYQRAARAWAESEAFSVLGEGYTHYHAIGVSPYWAKGQKGRRLGQHVFYKGIK